MKGTPMKLIPVSPSPKFSATPSLSRAHLRQTGPIRITLRATEATPATNVKIIQLRPVLPKLSRPLRWKAASSLRNAGP